MAAVVHAAVAVLLWSKLKWPSRLMMYMNFPSKAWWLLSNENCFGYKRWDSSEDASWTKSGQLDRRTHRQGDSNLQYDPPALNFLTGDKTKDKKIKKQEKNETDDSCNNNNNNSSRSNSCK